MKNLFILVSLGAFLAAAPAMAQDHHNDHHGPNAATQHNAQHNNHRAGPAGHTVAPNANAAHGNNAMRGPQAMRPAPNRTAQHNNRPNNRPHANMPARGTSHGNRTPRRGAHNSNAGRFSHLHRNYTATKRYRFGGYHRPRGYYSHRWVYGQRMPSAFFASTYWITNFATFGLMLPPPGTVWVRYGSDAVLIDRDTGEVIRVVYNIFY